MRALRKNGQTSRAEVANITGWSRAKTSQEVNALVEKGYLIDAGEGISKGGRKPRLLRFNSELGYVVGIDIGATSVEIALADVNGSILRRVTEAADVRQPPEDVLGRCSILLLDLVVAQHPSRANLGNWCRRAGPRGFCARCFGRSATDA